MSHTISVRIPDELASWLEETSKRTGISKGEIVREQIRKAREKNPESKAFMRHAGSIAGPANLSSRKGFQG